MQEHGKLAGDGDDGALFRGLAAAKGERESVAAQIAVLAEGSEHVLRRLDQELAQERGALTRDVQLRLALTGASGAGRKCKVGADDSAVRESRWVLESEHVSERGDRAAALDRLQCGAIEVLPCELLDRAVVLVDALAELRQEIDERLQRSGELGQKSLPGDFMHAIGRAIGQTSGNSSSNQDPGATLDSSVSL